jgi:predicted nucleic acid-binding protein
MIALDTNVLAYATDNIAGERHIQATHLVRSAIIAGAALPEQTLFEFLNFSTVKAKHSAADARILVEQFAATFRILYPPRTILRDVLRLLEHHKLSVWDARMIAVCSANACETLLSEDMQDGGRYGSVTVINPFNASNAAILRKAFAP